MPRLQLKQTCHEGAEYARLRHAAADRTLDKLILKKAASGNWCAPPVAPTSSTCDPA
jgi:hypothetical protein